jgi:hypothetical protein
VVDNRIADRGCRGAQAGAHPGEAHPELLDLLLLAPDLQVAVLGFEAVDGAEPMSEWALQAVAHAGRWGEQRGAFCRPNEGSRPGFVRGALNNPLRRRPLGSRIDAVWSLISSLPVSTAHDGAPMTDEVLTIKDGRHVAEAHGKDRVGDGERERARPSRYAVGGVSSGSRWTCGSTRGRMVVVTRESVVARTESGTKERDRPAKTESMVSDPVPCANGTAPRGAELLLDSWTGVGGGSS